MKEGDLDIVKLIIETMPEETELQAKIKFYMDSHKTDCNYFIYQKYARETTFFNTILKSLASDLGAEIVRHLTKIKMI